MWGCRVHYRDSGRPLELVSRCLDIASCPLGAESLVAEDHYSDPHSLPSQLFYLCAEVYQQTNPKDARSLGKDIWSIFLEKNAVRRPWVAYNFHPLDRSQAEENLTERSGRVQTGS